MTITAQFLSQCTEDQINKGVAWIEVNEESNFGDMCKFQYFACNAYLTNIRDYCTNPNDIMPIAFANGIGVEPPESGANYNEWEAGSGLFIRENGVQNYKVYSEHLNPLRAIAEVYILMSVSK